MLVIEPGKPRIFNARMYINWLTKTKHFFLPKIFHVLPANTKEHHIDEEILVPLLSISLQLRPKTPSEMLPEAHTALLTLRWSLVGTSPPLRFSEPLTRSSSCLMIFWFAVSDLSQWSDTEPVLLLLLLLLLPARRLRLARTLKWVMKN